MVDVRRETRRPLGGAVSCLRLYRGPQLCLLHKHRAGSPSAVLLTVNNTVMMHAGPSDFPALHAWLVKETEALKQLMREPEDVPSVDPMDSV